MGGVLEEEGEDVLEIVKGPSEGDGAEADDGSCVWAALGREELSVWTIRVNVCNSSRHTATLINPYRAHSQKSLSPN